MSSSDNNSNRDFYANHINPTNTPPRMKLPDIPPQQQQQQQQPQPQLLSTTNRSTTATQRSPTLQYNSQMGIESAYASVANPMTASILGLTRFGDDNDGDDDDQIVQVQSSNPSSLTSIIKSTSSDSSSHNNSGNMAGFERQTSLLMDLSSSCDDERPPIAKPSGTKFDAITGQFKHIDEQPITNLHQERTDLKLGKGGPEDVIITPITIPPTPTQSIQPFYETDGLPPPPSTPPPPPSSMTKSTTPLVTPDALPLHNSLISLTSFGGDSDSIKSGRGSVVSYNTATKSRYLPPTESLKSALNRETLNPNNFSYYKSNQYNPDDLFYITKDDLIQRTRQVRQNTFGGIINQSPYPQPPTQLEDSTVDIDFVDQQIDTLFVPDQRDIKNAGFTTRSHKDKKDTSSNNNNNSKPHTQLNYAFNGTPNDHVQANLIEHRHQLREDSALALTTTKVNQYVQVFERPVKFTKKPRQGLTPNSKLQFNLTKNETIFIDPRDSDTSDDDDDLTPEELAAMASGDFKTSNSNPVIQAYTYPDDDDDDNDDDDHSPKVPITKLRQQNSDDLLLTPNPLHPDSPLLNPLHGVKAPAFSLDDTNASTSGTPSESPFSPEDPDDIPKSHLLSPPPPLKRTMSKEDQIADCYARHNTTHVYQFDDLDTPVQPSSSKSDSNSNSLKDKRHQFDEKHPHPHHPHHSPQLSSSDSPTLFPTPIVNEDMIPSDDDGEEDSSDSMDSDSDLSDVEDYSKMTPSERDFAYSYARMLVVVGGSEYQRMKQKEKVKKRKESSSMAGIMSKYGSLFTTNNNPDLQPSGKGNPGGLELSFSIPTAESNFNFSSSDYVPFSPGALMSPGTRLDYEIRMEEEAAARAAASNRNSPSNGQNNQNVVSPSGFLARSPQTAATTSRTLDPYTQPRPAQPRQSQ